MSAVLKRGPANPVVYTFINSCVKLIPIFSRQLSDAMRPEDKLCMDKVKVMYPSSKLYQLNVRYLQEMHKPDIPSGSVLESIPKCLQKSLVACQILKTGNNSIVPLARGMFCFIILTPTK